MNLIQTIIFSMNFIYRFLLLFVLALLAGPLYAITINALIAFEVFQVTENSPNLGAEITRKSVFVWMGSLVVGLIGLFSSQKISYFLYSIPLLAPSAFAILYAASL